MKGINEVVKDQVRPMCLHGFYVDQHKCIDCANERIAVLEKQLKEAFEIAEQSLEMVRISTATIRTSTERMARMTDIVERGQRNAPQ